MCYICGLAGSSDSLQHFISCPMVRAAYTNFASSLAIPGDLSLPPLAAARTPADSRADTITHYSNFLCITSSRPSSLKAFLLALATFHWASWKVRMWAVDGWQGQPYEGFESQASYLALTTLNSIRSRLEAKKVKAQNAVTAKKSKTKMNRPHASVLVPNRPGSNSPNHQRHPTPPHTPPHHSSPNHLTVGSPSPARSPHTLSSPHGHKRPRPFNCVLTPPLLPYHYTLRR